VQVRVIAQLINSTSRHDNQSNHISPHSTNSHHHFVDHCRPYYPLFIVLASQKYFIKSEEDSYFQIVLYIIFAFSTDLPSSSTQAIPWSSSSDIVGLRSPLHLPLFLVSPQHSGKIPQSRSREVPPTLPGPGSFPGNVIKLISFYPLIIGMFF
jgi:hypothetical protein